MLAIVNKGEDALGHDGRLQKSGTVLFQAKKTTENEDTPGVPCFPT